MKYGSRQNLNYIYINITKIKNKNVQSNCTKLLIGVSIKNKKFI